MNNVDKSYEYVKRIFSNSARLVHGRIVIFGSPEMPIKMQV